MEKEENFLPRKKYVAKLFPKLKSENSKEINTPHTPRFDTNAWIFQPDLRHDKYFQFK